MKGQSFFDMFHCLCHNFCMIQTVLKYMLCLFTAICCCGCKPYEKITRILFASDLHYLSDELYDDGEAFLSVITNADGKYMPYIEQLTDAFVDQVITDHPDVLVLSGDLTFNGEKISHEHLTQKLEKIEQNGIRVCVIPGNHDIENPYARKYEEDEVLFTGSISRDSFVEMYDAFGYEDALYKDRESFSYVTEVDDQTWLLLLDVNASLCTNAFTQNTLKWIEDVLQAGKKEGVHVISITHQNLLQHSLFTDGFIIDNAEDVISLFEEYGVRVNMSGHMHIQHQSSSDALLECTVSALSVSPLQYGVMDVSDDHILYHTEQLDVAEWAKDHHLEGYENFHDDAEDFFVETGKKRKNELNVQEDLLDAYMRLNCAYFSGYLKNVEISEEMISRWKESDPYTWVYIQSILQEKGNDYRNFEIDLKSPSRPLNDRAW